MAMSPEQYTETLSKFAAEHPDQAFAYMKWALKSLYWSASDLDQSMETNILNRAISDAKEGA